MDVLIVVLAGGLVAATLLPFSGSQSWWVRASDFPRVQIAVALVLVLPLTSLLPMPWRWVVAAAAAGALLVQVHKIRPFTPLARKEMHFAAPRGDGAEVTCLAVNVLMENDRHDLVRALVEREDPDVLLLMETDRRWAEALEPVLRGYPTVLREPKDNHYGMILATRLAAREARFEYLTPDDAPTAFAVLETPSGRPFHFVGLHPRPPTPGVDTDERDTQILYAARFARAADRPLIAMGDFNAAAWSPTSQLFKSCGRYLDPRVGRGLYASFHAKNILVRCAIDQLYVTEDVAATEFRMGDAIGSDHFPVLARLRIDPEQAARLNVRPPPMTAAEREAIEARVRDYSQRLDVPRPKELAERLDEA